MTQAALKIDAARSAVLIMDFQQRIVNNVASEPEAVVRNAAKALEGARTAGIPVIYVVHRGGPFAEYAPDVELHEGVTPAEGERIITKTKPGPFSTTALDVNLREMGRGHADRDGGGHQRLRAVVRAVGSRRELQLCRGRGCLFRCGPRGAPGADGEGLPASGPRSSAPTSSSRRFSMMMLDLHAQAHGRSQYGTLS